MIRQFNPKSMGIYLLGQQKGREGMNFVLTASMADGTQQLFMSAADQFYPASATSRMQHPSGGDAT